MTVDRGQAVPGEFESLVEAHGARLFRLAFSSSMTLLARRMPFKSPWSGLGVSRLRRGRMKG